MANHQIEYCVARDAQGDWMIMRQNDQIARRGDMFDAVALATYFAECEARSSHARVKVVLGERQAFAEAKLARQLASIRPAGQDAPLPPLRARLIGRCVT
ncbi:MAG TPA: hypothetical protein VIM98_10430 [Dyella sp.]|uniref:hypothetical protein n=1 Tax=Dyella sp. TaxID=1869338 RepID=UPI002F927969